MMSDLETLLHIIEAQLDWGSGKNWQSRDFEELNVLILQKTNVSLSASTLRRIWGRVKYQHLPSGTTLDTLAKFAGFENWRTFTRRTTPPVDLPVKSNEVFPAKSKTKVGWKMTVALSLISIGIISLVSWYVRQVSAPAVNRKYAFSSRAVTRGIPNSVIFTYDVTAAPTDSIFIQQSWDPNTRVQIAKQRHQHTSVYYRPGFYKAELLINKKVVKEHPLLIASNGWLGLIEQKRVPVYLDSTDFIGRSGLEVSEPVIQRMNVALNPKPPVLQFYNIGNFNPVPLQDFSYEAEVKNDYHQGAAACQLINVSLITDDVPIIIPLSAIGCVSELILLNGIQFVSGKSTDLSGFGANLSRWVKVSCRSTAGRLQYYIDGKLAYESPLPAKKSNIVGVVFTFQGTGAVRHIQLQAGNKVVFKTFWI